MTSDNLFHFENYVLVDFLGLIKLHLFTAFREKNSLSINDPGYYLLFCAIKFVISDHLFWCWPKDFQEKVGPEDEEAYHSCEGI